MKKWMTLLLALLLAIGTRAQDPTLTKIQKANAAIGNVECAFTRTRTLPATGKVVKHDGQLYFSAPERMAMVYNTDKEALVIDGNTLYLKRAGKPSTFDTSNNALMRSLRNMLIDCVKGNCQKVADDNNAEITAKEVAEYYNVTMTSREAGVTGFSKIFLTYRKKDGLLVRLETIEFGGIDDVYTMSGFKKVDSIDAARFAMPKARTAAKPAHQGKKR